MHERGLAVDFTCGSGYAIGRSSPCYSWLVSNAGSYGFINLPSEPWHWSVNGNCAAGRATAAAACAAAGAPLTATYP
jgi:hypothetical protein